MPQNDDLDLTRFLEFLNEPNEPQLSKVEAIEKLGQYSKVNKKRMEYRGYGITLCGDGYGRTRYFAASKYTYSASDAITAIEDAIDAESAAKANKPPNVLTEPTKKFLLEVWTVVHRHVPGYDRGGELCDGLSALIADGQIEEGSFYLGESDSKADEEDED